LSIVELRTKLISVATFLVGTLYGIVQTDELSPVITLLMLAAVLSVDMGTTAFNNFFDFFHGTDMPAFNVEENKVLVHQQVAPGWALIIALSCYAVAAPLGLTIAYLRGWWIIPVGALSMLVGYFYTGGPRPISTTPFGDLFAGGFLGLLLFVLSAAVQAPSGAELLSWWLLVAATPPFLTVASILTVNNTCDREGDEEAGRRTVAVVLGPRRSAVLVYLQGTLAHGALFVLVAAGRLPWPAAVFAAVSALFAWRSYRGMHRRGYSFKTKGANMVAVLKVFAGEMLMYAAGLVAALIIQ